MLARAREAADAPRRRPLVAVTFDPHPMAVLRPEHAPPTLTTIEHPRASCSATPASTRSSCCRFDREVAAWSPQEFVDRVLVDALHAAAVVVGANFRFGARAAGDVATLREAGATRGFDAEGVALDGGPQVWSSTYVRTCLAAGDVAGAAEALGRPFTVRGIVVEGDQRGRELGYPTANVPIRRRSTRPPPTASTPAGCPGSTPASATRPRSASAPTRPSTASASAGSSPTCSTATTSSSTASRSRSPSSTGCAGW